MSTRIVGERALDTWVSVERRWLGLDRRTIPPALVSIALIIVFAVILPAIDRSIDFDRQIEAGDVVNLGSGITFVPAVGWGFPDGLLVGHGTVGGVEESSPVGAHLVNGGVSFTARPGPFVGTPDELLDRVTDLNEAFGSVDRSTYMGEPMTVTTINGVTGVAQAFVGVNVEGVITTFVIDGVGIEFVVSGPPGTLDNNADAIDGMITSLDSRREVVDQ